MPTEKIEIIFHASFREITKERAIIEEISEGCTIASIIVKLTEKYGNYFKDIIDQETNKISNDVLIMVNGKSVRETTEKLKDKDILIFTLPLGGG